MGFLLKGIRFEGERSRGKLPGTPYLFMEVTREGMSNWALKSKIPTVEVHFSTRRWIACVWLKSELSQGGRALVSPPVHTHAPTHTHAHTHTHAGEPGVGTKNSFGWADQ